MKYFQTVVFPLIVAATAALPLPAHAQTVEARAKSILSIDGLDFRDLNGNGRLDLYEDWRRKPAERADDLVARMSLDEKAGMMLIDTLNADIGGTLPEQALRLIGNEHMTRFILRNPVVWTPDPSAPAGSSGPDVTPGEAALYANAIQEAAERTRLGIPVLFKSNARNHYEEDPRPGINVAASAFSVWPKEPGLAAMRDLELIGEFGEIMATEWTAIGLRGMYGYMADLATEPRWYRIHETFGEDAELTADIVETLVESLQGRELGPASIALTIKHFPGGGPQQGGADPHYRYGRNQIYPNGNFDYHVRPFEAAIDAGVAAVMPYYGIPVDQAYLPNDVGMAFSKGILSDLLRDELGFEGYVNSDTGIIGSRAWGLESLGLEEQLLTAIEAGTDVVSGFDDKDLIVRLVGSGRLSERRVDESVERLLIEQFELGLFENPYVDAAAAATVVGRADFREEGALAQRKSIVLLDNDDRLLPLPAPSAFSPINVYTIGINANVTRAAGFTVTTGEHAVGTALPAVPAGTDYALIRVRVTNPVTDIVGDPLEPAPQQTIFGGAMRDEIDLLTFSDMATSLSWTITPSLQDIQSVMSAVGPERTVLAIYFRQPYVLDDASGLRDAGALVALFGVDDAALVDVLTGQFAPNGKLPFALANNGGAILRQAPDEPGYDDDDTLYPFGFGLTYR